MTVPRSTTSDELTVSWNGPVLFLTLNRPDQRNALSRSLVIALRDAIESAGSDGSTRVIVLAGNGPTFCAGGDITQFAHAPDEQRALDDANGLIELLGAMTSSPLPVVVRAHGAIFGGGVGLACAADIVIAAESAKFSLSEARLGIVPAVISPYVVQALGPREARARMLQASPFDTEVALRIGLVHQCVPDDMLDDAVDRVLGDLLQCAPGALAIAKRIPAMVASTDSAEIDAETASLFAERITSDEGRKGLRAFLEKRPAPWAQEWRRR